MIGAWATLNIFCIYFVRRKWRFFILTDRRGLPVFVFNLPSVAQCTIYISPVLHSASSEENTSCSWLAAGEPRIDEYSRSYDLERVERKSESWWMRSVFSMKNPDVTSTLRQFPWQLLSHWNRVKAKKISITKLSWWPWYYPWFYFSFQINSMFPRDWRRYYFTMLSFDMQLIERVTMKKWTEPAGDQRGAGDQHGAEGSAWSCVNSNLC